MGVACSRKRDQQVNEDIVHRGVSKSGSSKWLGTSISRASIDIKQGNGKCPSLMELCIYKICEVCGYLYQGRIWKQEDYSHVDSYIQF